MTSRIKSIQSIAPVGNRLDAIGNEKPLKKIYKIEFYKAIQRTNSLVKNQAIAWNRIQLLAANRLDILPIACLQAIAYKKQSLRCFGSQNLTDLFLQSRRLFKYYSVIAVFENN